MPSDVTVRLATAEDRPGMETAWRASLDAAQGRARERRFDYPWEAVVAEAEGRIVGFSGWAGQPGECLGEVKGNYVHPDFQGRGISTRLVAEVMRRLKRMGARVVKVRTGESNAVARHIYEKLGGRLLAVAPHYARELGGGAAEPSDAAGAAIRAARPGDAAGMEALALSKAQRLGAFEPKLLEERHGILCGTPWRRQCAAPADLAGALVAERGGELAGYALRGPAARFWAPVLAAAEEDGDLGRRLIEAVCRDMAAAGAARATVEVLDQDAPAILALQGTGFARVGAIVIYTADL